MVDATRDRRRLYRIIRYLVTGQYGEDTFPDIDISLIIVVGRTDVGPVYAGKTAGPGRSTKAAVLVLPCLLATRELDHQIASGMLREFDVPTAYNIIFSAI